MSKNIHAGRKAAHAMTRGAMAASRGRGFRLGGALLALLLTAGHAGADYSTVGKLADFISYRPFTSFVEGSDGMLYYGATSGPAMLGRIGMDGSEQHVWSASPRPNVGTGMRLHKGRDGYIYLATDGTGDANARSVHRLLPGESSWQTFFAFPACNTGILVCAASSIVQANDGRFYGTAGASAANNVNNGIWTTSADGTGLTKLLNDADVVGDRPFFMIQASDGAFYGLTMQGGASGMGVLFRMTSDGTVAGTTYEVVHEFDGSDGRYSTKPAEPLLEGGDGYLYGISTLGGGGNVGTLWRLKLDTKAFELLYDAPATENTSGKSPRSIMLGADGHVYGVASAGGIDDMGVVFRYHKAQGYQTLYAFSAAAEGTATAHPLGTQPYALTQTGSGDFYVGTYSGGTASVKRGTLLKFTPGDDIPVYSFVPSLTLTASVGTVAAGNPVRLSWVGQKVANCRAASNEVNSAWAGERDGSGNEAYVPLNEGSWTYTLSCDSTSADYPAPVEQTVTLTVQPPVLSLSASHSVVAQDYSGLTFTWSAPSTSGGCTASSTEPGSAWTGSRAASATEAYVPRTLGTWDYTLTCVTGLAAYPEPLVRTVTVTVEEKSPVHAPGNGGGGGAFSAGLALLPLLGAAVWRRRRMA